MAHKKGAGSSDNGRDSNAKYLGVKLFGGQPAIAGNIIVRQRGTKFHAGENVYKGKDFTLHAKVDGIVDFKKRRSNRTYVSILPIEGAERFVATNSAKSQGKIGNSEKKSIPSGGKRKLNDLTVVEGIGPKIASLLKDAGINTWEALSNTEVEKIQDILSAAGSNYATHNPSTWPKQAGLAVAGKWDELKQLQDYLVGGVDPNA